MVFSPGLTPDDRAALLKGAHDKAGEHLSRLLKFVVARAGEGFGREEGMPVCQHLMRFFLAHQAVGACSGEASHSCCAI